MRNEPSDLTPARIAAALAEHWSVPGCRLAYVPLGFGSHHWAATRPDGSRLFVTADRVGNGPETAEERLNAAYLTVAALQERGLDFVVAPLPSRDGTLLQRPAPGWALAVFEYQDGKAAGEGEWRDLAGAAEAARLIGRLHSEPPPAVLRRFSFRLPRRDELFAGLEQPWRSGPYGEQTRALLAEARPHVEALLRHYDALVHAALRDSGRWVITHGEPHSGNFIRDEAGRLHLIDWDTVRLAPRERDLSSLPVDAPEVLAAYQSMAGAVQPRAALLELFRAWWDLCEICIYADHYRNQHEDTEDDAIRWPAFRDYLDIAARWPALVR